ncbi:MAG: Hsp20/alpha crystallin family protein, partial [Bacteroidota bacterium]
ERSSEDLSIKLHKNKLVISTIEKEASSSEVKYKLKEFDFEGFKRSFFISDKVEKKGIKASMKDGLLKVWLPKKEEAKSPEDHEIEIL